MARTPYKMKGYSYPGTSPMKGVKPTRKELVAAANDKSNPNHISKMGEDAYYAWRGGFELATRKKTYHGAGGKVMNEDGTVNEAATKGNKIR